MKSVSYRDAIVSIHQNQSALAHHMQAAKLSGFVCPACGNGTGNDGTGIDYIKHKGNMLKCHRCGWRGDIIEYFSLSEQISNYEAVSRLAAELGLQIDKAQPDRLTEQHTEATEAPEQPKIDYSANYAEWRRNASEGAETAAYMESRGISREVWEKCGIGYCQEHNSIVFIVNKYTYAERYLDPDKKNRYEVSKGGSFSLWNEQALNDENDVVFIVEGMFDSLTLSEAGLPSVAIRSASEKEKAAELICKHPSAKKKCFCLLLDTDTAGTQAAVKIQNIFTAAGIIWRNESLAVVSPYKDINEAFLADKEGIKQRLHDASERCLAMLETRQKESKENAPEAGTVASDPEHRLPEIREAIEARQLPKGIILEKPVSEYLQKDFGVEVEEFKQFNCPTGFRYFDAMSGGGLYCGLYIITAVSGGGKSTFALQLADELASRKKHILFFSLEQSRLELVSKSIARTIKKEDRNSKLSSLQIRQGRQPEKVKQAMQKYVRRIGDRLTIIEGNFNTNPSFIRDYAETYKAVMNETPLIIVDYLQILQPDRDPRTGKKPSDLRQATDENINKLKVLSRDLKTSVICVSSLNRTAYREAISFEGLKESGMIEHSADFVAGFQYAKIENATTDSKKELKRIMDEESRKECRSMVLSVIKTRTGRLFKDYFSFYPCGDLFEEDGERPTKAAESKPAETVI